MEKNATAIELATLAGWRANDKRLREQLAAMKYEKGKLHDQIRARDAVIKGADVQLGDAVEQIERLHEVISNPKMTELELEPGGALRLGLEPCLGAKVLAASFSDMLGDAKHWASVIVGPMPSDNGLIVVTAQRYREDSPEVSYGKACDLLRQFRDLFPGDVVLDLGIPGDPETTNLIALADEFLQAR